MKPIKTTYIIMLLTLTSCGEDWLNVKSDKQLVVPTSLKDLQALLDNTSEMNFSTTPSLGEVSTTDYYLMDEDWNALASEEQRNAYKWNQTIHAGESCYSWNYPYESILHANLALDGLKNIPLNPANSAAWNNIHGSALFYRSWAFFQLAQVFCKPYDQQTASQDLGIPLRMEADINIPSVRASIQQVYAQITADTRRAIDQLPTNPLVLTRPGKAAAYGLLAKTYLHMEKYDSAWSMATHCLSLSNQLLDYNEMDQSAEYPFSQMNEEVIFHTTMAPLSALFRVMNVDTVLYKKYTPNDLRKPLYYRVEDGRISFKGTYDASIRLFSGLAVDEVKLLKAECEARLGQVTEAMSTLNSLLVTRWKTGSYIPATAENQIKAIALILEERQKSLPYRGIHWMDLRRTASEPEFATTLYRKLEGQLLALEPNDLRWVMPIPDEVIEFSGMTQNPR